MKHLGMKEVFDVEIGVNEIATAIGYQIAIQSQKTREHLEKRIKSCVSEFQ